MLSGRELTVRSWEQQLGREGLWCGRCRHVTPVLHLRITGAAATLACERCAAVLLRGQSWLHDVAGRPPQPRTDTCIPVQGTGASERQR